MGEENLTARGGIKLNFSASRGFAVVRKGTPSAVPQKLDRYWALAPEGGIAAAQRITPAQKRQGEK